MKKLVIGNNRQMFNDVVSTDNSFINVDDSVISNNDSLKEDIFNNNKYCQKKGYCRGRFIIKRN